MTCSEKGCQAISALETLSGVKSGALKGQMDPDVAIAVVTAMTPHILADEYVDAEKKASVIAMDTLDAETLDFLRSTGEHGDVRRAAAASALRQDMLTPDMQFAWAEQSLKRAQELSGGRPTVAWEIIEKGDLTAEQQYDLLVTASREQQFSAIRPILERAHSGASPNFLDADDGRAALEKFLGDVGLTSGRFSAGGSVSRKSFAQAFSLLDSADHQRIFDELSAEKQSAVLHNMDDDI